MDYTIKSDQFPSRNRDVDISKPAFARDQRDGSIVPDAVDVILSYIKNDGERRTVPFTCVPEDEMEYGRQLYAEAMNGTFGEIAPAPPWNGPYPDPEPTEDQKRIALLEEKLSALLEKSEAS